MKMTERTLAIQELMDTSGVRFGTSGVRGLAVNMTSEVCFAYTAAFLTTLPPATRRVALAMDLRPSSPAIAAACAAAIEYAGLEVRFCGAIPTPALAYYAQAHGVPGIMVTGSHIPFDRNGIKFYATQGEITKADEISISRAKVTLPQEIHVESLTEPDPTAMQVYIDRYVEFFPPQCLAGMKLGFYEHSGVARDLLGKILTLLGAEVTSLGRTNNFVPIDTEAVGQEDIERAQRWSAEYGFDALLSTDGDADRPLIGDEKGDWLRGDIVGILCAQYLEADAVVTTVSCNTAVEKCGGFAKVLRTRIGSPYVIEGIEQMLDAGAQRVVGFEPNGGFLVGSSLEKNGRALPRLATRDAVLPILSILAMAREQNCRVSDLLKKLPERFTASDRLSNFPVEKSSELLQRLTESDVTIKSLLGGLCGELAGLDQTDGVRIVFENGEIIHFRPSGNAPELRCYAEAASQQRADLLVRESLDAVMLRMNSSCNFPCAPG